MASDWEDLCNSYDIPLDDPDGLDRLLDVIHSYEDEEEFQMEIEYHMDYFDATAQFCGHPDYLGIGTWLITIDTTTLRLEALKYDEGEGGREHCDVFDFLCKIDEIYNELITRKGFDNDKILSIISKQHKGIN